MFKSESDTHPHIITASQLSLRIRDSRDSLISSFLEIARAAVPAAENKSTVFLENHLPQVLEAVAAILFSRGGESAKTALSALAAQHGSQRSRSDEYTPAQIRREYRILRNQILNLIRNGEELNRESVALLADCFELAIGVTIEVFMRAHEA